MCMLSGISTHIEYMRSMRVIAGVEYLQRQLSFLLACSLDLYGMETEPNVANSYFSTTQISRAFHALAELLATVFLLSDIIGVPINAEMFGLRISDVSRCHDRQAKISG